MSKTQEYLAMKEMIVNDLISAVKEAMVKEGTRVCVGKTRVDDEIREMAEKEAEAMLEEMEEKTDE